MKLKDSTAVVNRMMVKGFEELLRAEEDYNDPNSMVGSEFKEGTFSELDRLDITFVATYKSGQQLIVRPAMKPGDRNCDPLAHLPPDDPEDGRILLPSG